MSKSDSSWDWRWLYFIGRYEFKFSDKEFWELTPRQLCTYSTEYVKYKEETEGSSENANKSKAEPKAVYIDQLW